MYKRFPFCKEVYVVRTTLRKGLSCNQIVNSFEEKERSNIRYLIERRLSRLAYYRLCRDLEFHECVAIIVMMRHLNYSQWESVGFNTTLVIEKLRAIRFSLIGDLIGSKANRHLFTNDEGKYGLDARAYKTMSKVLR